MFYFDPLYLIIAIPGLILALWAQSRVKSAFKKYSKVRTSRNLTGAQVARELLDANGLYGVAIERVKGELSDHYDPRGKVLRLSQGVHDSPSVAAAGIAAHEMGHALQDQAKYAPLQVRSLMVPAVRFSSRLGPMIFFAGLMLSFFTGGSSTLSLSVMTLGLILFAASVVFSLVTLPVELNASRRAKELLVTHDILYPSEMEGVNKVLNAAAWTYVAAAVQAILTLLYYVTIMNRRR